MNEIATDLSPAALIAAIEANLWEAARIWARLLDSEIIETKEHTCFISGMPFSMFNGVIRARFSSETANDGMAALFNKFEQRSVPFSWLISPSTQPADVEQHLVNRGFKLDEEEIGMAIDLSLLPSDLALPPGLRIVEVDNKTILEGWIRVMAVGSGFPRSVVDLLNNIQARHRLARRSVVRFYLGLLNNEPVATSLLLFAGGVAGLYCVATLPEARRRGIGHAMTTYPLMIAHSESYRIGTLQASQMGFNIYRRLGFQEYCRFHVYFS
ncbi:MAG: GNAT family N-acetyltransferase [Ktedonobacteraceae bacterium]|nr:GNAT family N-acetyltransferase [Ktedonobacteraceae bacterium]MBO0789587.1 GNAT family N-acetyltransferase [Ktedonobacteraceae bacterium]